MPAATAMAPCWRKWFQLRSRTSKVSFAPERPHNIFIWPTNSNSMHAKMTKLYVYFSWQVTNRQRQNSQRVMSELKVCLHWRGHFSSSQIFVSILRSLLSPENRLHWVARISQRSTTNCTQEWWLNYEIQLLVYLRNVLSATYPQPTCSEWLLYFLNSIRRINTNICSNGQATLVQRNQSP